MVTEEIKINKKLATKVLAVVDKGLSCGIGVRTPGKMCVEAAVCYALGLPHGDDPPCVCYDVRKLKIALNDIEEWGSKKNRARGMRRLAIAQLGTEAWLSAERDKFKAMVHAYTNEFAKKIFVEVGERLTNQSNIEYYLRLIVQSSGYAGYIIGEIARDMHISSKRAKAILAEFSEGIVQILRKLNSPGSKFLPKLQS